MYYSTLNKAVADINNNTIGENADVPKEEAVAAAYVDENGKFNAVLLKDSVEDVTTSPNVDMTINLGGNTLSVNAVSAIEVTGGNVVIYGRLEGSSIEMDYDNVKSRCVYITGGSLTVNGGTYINNSTDASYTYVFVCYANSSIENATIEINNVSGPVYGIGVLSEAFISNCEVDAIGDAQTIGIYTSNKATLSNCDIDVKSSSGWARGINIGSSSTVTVSNCDVMSSSPNGSDGIGNFGTATISNTSSIAQSNKKQSGIGFVNEGDLTLYNCYAKGTDQGVASVGTLYVNGGTYEGYIHGGFYFVGTDSVSYVENASIKNCEWDFDLEKPSNWSSFNSAFYIGTNPNVTVYMNNCDIWTWIKGFTFRSGNGEANNVLYISNSEIKSLYSNAYGEKGDTCIRIDATNPNNKLFIGRGCNFTADDVAYNGDTSGVTNTDEVYTRP